MSNCTYNTVRIESYTKDLLGKSIKNGKEYFFPYVKVGDLIHFEEIGRGKNKHYKVLEISSAFNSNFSKKCQYFGNCGGCRAQQIAYDLQFELKTSELKEYYHMQYGILPKSIPATNIWKYRNRMDFVVFPNKIGLRQEGNYRKIIDISYCEIQSELANLELQKIKNFLQNENIAYNRKTRTGFLKYLTLRTNSDHSELMLILTFIDSVQNPLEEEISQFLLKNSLATHIIFCYNRERSEVSAQGKFKIIKGNYFFNEKLFNKTIQVPFDSFLQPNLQGFFPILNFIQEKLKNSTNQKLLDMFCGIGFFSILFGDKFSKLSGFDITFSSIEKAKLNLTKLYPQKEINFQVVDLYNIKKNLLELDESNTTAIVDPPRNGLGKHVLEILGKSNIPILIYVSCNPYSQKSDYEFLCKSYKLLDLLITDPYPHTTHLESVMYLEKRL